MWHDTVIDAIIGVVDTIWGRVVGGLGWILILIERQLPVWLLAAKGVAHGRGAIYCVVARKTSVSMKSAQSCGGIITEVILHERQLL